MVIIAIHRLSSVKWILGMIFAMLSVPGIVDAQTSIQRYIATYKPLADSLASSYGMPSSVILGISILESGSGKSRNARLLNNHFGIVGKNDLMKTHGIKSRYRQYPSDTASYIHFCQVMSRKKYYTSLKGNPDAGRWIHTIAAGGYSEVPATWTQRVLSIIRKYRL